MLVPYTAEFAAKLLEKMSDERLEAITPAAFQRYPAPHLLPTKTGESLIDAERAARRNRKAP